METPVESTRERLLNIAEQRFGEGGYEGTSLRAITVAAAANIAAVNYHFGSKEALLRAAVARAMAPVNTERRRRLDQLEAKGQPTAEQLIRAFIEPGLDLVLRRGERGPVVARFIGRVAFDPSQRIRELYAAESDPVEARYLAALQAALPRAAAESVAFGYVNMLGLLALHQSQALTRAPGTEDVEDPGKLAENLIAFLVAAFDRGLRA
ncbi:TetR family transcriptional regulator [Kribbella orskensis]|uniref:TetR family transcriptional regulator n=1 Tax=Kribbella orskensis TaxID=2512216 RepID=A0ABY2B776_9ACTN|nr:MULTISPECIES: TetR family transcriptional regulator [Kribbella]TCN29992.1 TetR family transcriptional regulator [Kribbella sp. VKM Ac-2500]TCO10096.1 TetR family transcriptional regulator [Kribbella orskensis]